MLAEFDAIRYVAVAFAVYHSVGMVQANRVLTPLLNDRVGFRLFRDDIPDATLLEAMQPLTERAYTGQTNQHRLFNLDQGTILSTTPDCLRIS